MNGRRADLRRLEQRLRDEAPRGRALSAEFRGELARRLDAQPRSGRDGEADPRGRRGRGTCLVDLGGGSRGLGWALAGGALGAAALVIAGAAMWARVSPRPERAARPAVAEALGDAVQASMEQPPRVLALAIERGDGPLAAETQRLIEDARTLAERLAGPVRSMGYPAP
ncbi:MAG TPA: hypothetical protein VFF69_10530 [Phycisphaerales bacterium]|nr:hypothetical protein [Phycisphaerales bacterium]